jgi:hypothetical protein
MQSRSTHWSHDLVLNRLKAAVRISRSLPRCAPHGYKSTWPQIIRLAHESIPLGESRPPRYIPMGNDVEEMLEVMRWVQWLDVPDRHILWGYASRTPQATTMRKLGISRATLHRRVTAAVAKLLDRLNDTAGD